MMLRLLQVSLGKQGSPQMSVDATLQIPGKAWVELEGLGQIGDGGFEPVFIAVAHPSSGVGLG